MEVITDPVAVAAECCEFGKRRMGSMQPKWFRRYDVAAEHEVWFSDGMAARPGRVTAIDDDGRYTVVDEPGDRHEQLKREQICHQLTATKIGGAKAHWPNIGWYVPVRGPDCETARERAHLRFGRRMGRRVFEQARTTVPHHPRCEGCPERWCGRADDN